MKAMITKELRENLPCAILAAICVSLAEWYYQAHDGQSTQTHVPIYVFAFASWTTFGGPIIAAVFGFVQIIRERKRDQWAFLFHRPATPTSLFAGKVIAGLTLYFAATLIPFFGAVWWTAVPGHVAAPFDIRLSLAGVADIMNGVLFYFAAMLTALRPARWFGSRALAFPAAFVITFLLIISQNFPFAVLGWGIAIVVFGIAAWGSFLIEEPYTAQPRAARICLGATFYCGCAVMLVLACFGPLALIPRPFMSRSAQYNVNSNGEISIATYQYNSSHVGTLVSLTDLHGRKLADRNYLKDGLSAGSTLWPTTFGSHHDYRSTDTYVQSLGYINGDNNVAWFYVRGEGRFVAYGLIDHRLIGSIGRDGFAQGNQTGGSSFDADAMVNSVTGGAHVFEHNAVYEIDLSSRLVRKVVFASSDEPVVIEGQSDYFEIGLNGSFLVATNKGLRFILNGTLSAVTIPLHFIPNESFTVYRLTNGNGWRINVQSNSIANSSFPKARSFLYSAAGTPLQSDTLPALPQFSDAFWVDRVRGNLPYILMPLGLDLGSGLFDALYGVKHDSIIPKDLLPSFTTWGAALGVLAACLSLLIGRRCGYTLRQWLPWMIGIVFLGPIGLVMLLALQGWPARERCAKCHGWRVVDRETCEHCGAQWPVPARDGTEIFDEYVPLLKLSA